MFGLFGSKEKSINQEFETDVEKPEQEGLLSSIGSRATNIMGSVTDRVRGAQQAAETSYQTMVFFAVSVGIGVLLIMLSLMYLPFLVLKPSKFSSLFMLGQISIWYGIV